jgi:hypothetical protein
VCALLSRSIVLSTGTATAHPVLPQRVTTFAAIPRTGIGAKKTKSCTATHRKTIGPSSIGRRSTLRNRQSLTADCLWTFCLMIGRNRIEIQSFCVSSQNVFQITEVTADDSQIYFVVASVSLPVSFSVSSVPRHASFQIVQFDSTIQAFDRLHPRSEYRPICRRSQFPAATPAEQTKQASRAHLPRLKYQRIGPQIFADDLQRVVNRFGAISFDEHKLVRRYKVNF